jgi:hypothetical protein
MFHHDPDSDARILNLALAPGLIERTAYGKQAVFQITRLGADALRRYLERGREQLNDELDRPSREEMENLIMGRDRVDQAKISPAAKPTWGPPQEQTRSPKPFGVVSIAKPAIGIVATRLERAHAEAGRSIETNMLKINKPKGDFHQAMADYSESASFMQIQSECAKAFYASVITSAVKIGEIYTDLAKVVFKPGNVPERGAARSEGIVRSARTHSR